MLIGSVDTQEACCLVMRRVNIRKYNTYSVFYQWKQWEISTRIAEKAKSKDRKTKTEHVHESKVQVLCRFLLRLRMRT